MDDGDGVVLYGLGYSIWATDYTRSSPNLGIANGITAAAAVGTAFILVGSLGNVRPFTKRQSCTLVLLCLSDIVCNQWVCRHSRSWVILGGKR